MTEKEIEKMATLVAQKAVEEILVRLGVDVENPRESQADYLHLRKQRLASEQIGKMTMRVVLSVSITGLLSLLIMGIKEHLK